jgi:hypothetical protein
VFFKNPAQITECFSDGQRVGVLVSKPGGSHSPWLDVGVAVAPGDDQDHPAAEGTMMLVLSAVVPWALRNAKAFQGVDQKVGETRCNLAIALGPSFLSHLKQGQGKQSGTGAKGVDNTYYYNRDGSVFMDTWSLG